MGRRTGSSRSFLLVSPLCHWKNMGRNLGYDLLLHSLYFGIWDPIFSAAFSDGVLVSFWLNMRFIISLFPRHDYM